MAGTIDLAERCYPGLEARDDALWLNPRLPDEVTRLHTTLAYRGHQLQITAIHGQATVAASPCDATPVSVRAGGHLLQLTGGTDHHRDSAPTTRWTRAAAEPAQG